MTQQNKTLDDISTMLINIDNSVKYSVNDYYIMLTRSFLEIRKLQHEVKVLEAKLNG